MLPNLERKVIGNLQLSVYTFNKKGDELPTHTHPEGEAHITIVNKGSIKAYGNGWQKVLKAGNLVMFPPNDPHAFVALENDSKITNIIY
jgi:quercetin dioxygenase-like cupin family protein